MRAAVIALATLATTAASGVAHADNMTARQYLAEGNKLAETGNDAQALAKYERAIREDQDLIAAYRAAIPLWIQLDRLKVMSKRLERATLRHPEFADAWYALGYAYRKRGRFDYAEVAYETYIGLRPSEPAPYFGLAMAYKEGGKRDRAKRAFRRYLRLENDPKRSSFIERARLELDRLEGKAPPPPMTIRQIAAAVIGFSVRMLAIARERLAAQ